jgi:hypothetical protein
MLFFWAIFCSKAIQKNFKECSVIDLPFFGG